MNNNIKSSEIVFSKVISYITTYSFILYILTLITLGTMGFGVLLGIIIFNFLKKMGSYNINIGSDFVTYQENLLKSKFFPNYKKSKNFTLIQISIYFISLVIFLFIDGIFTGGLIALIFVAIQLILTSLHYNFLNKISKVVED